MHQPILKTRVLSLLLTILTALTVATALPAAERGATAPDGYLSDDERTEALALLEGTKRELLERVAGLSDEALHFKPAPDRWSIAQILEHLVIVEGNVLESVDATIGAPADPQWAKNTDGQIDRLYRFVPIRVRKFQAPESVQPKNDTSRRELIRSFETLRARSIEVIRDASKPVKAHTSDHSVLGRLNAHQWILFSGLHNLRHNQQVLEVMADPGFPH